MGRVLMDTIIARAPDLEKQLQPHVNKNCGHQSWTEGKFRGKNLIKIYLRDNIDIILQDCVILVKRCTYQILS